MNISKGHMHGVYTISAPPAYTDKRGSLVRIFDARVFHEYVEDIRWVQQSFSQTVPKNVLRGMHVQCSPFTEAKLITIISGEIYWVVVDLRRASPTFGQWDGFVLSPNNTNGLLVLRGFAHGCLSLTDNCCLVINSDNYYSKEHGTGIVWNDPELAINWPFNDMKQLIISDEHRAYPSFKSFKAKYGGVDV